MKMEQRLIPGQYQRQELRQDLKLSARQLQTLRMLQTPRMDLESEVALLVDDNPALELTPELPDTIADIDREGSGTDNAHQEDRKLSDAQEAALDFWESTTPSAYDDGEYEFRSAAPKYETGDEDPKTAAMLAVESRPKTLEEHLLDQLGLLTLDPKVRVAAIRIIQSLDQSGFLPAPLDTVVPWYTPEEEQTAKQALEVVRRFDPTGVGALNVQEALLMQISEDDPDRPLFEELLLKHWDDLLHNRLRKVADQTGRDLEEVAFLWDCIRQLNPHPARDFGMPSANPMIPDVVFETDPDAPWTWRARALEEWTPRLRVKPNFRRRIEEARAAGDKAAAQYYVDRMRRAEEAVRDLRWVRSTLEQVAALVLERQHDFMESGIGSLKPLKMDEIAQELKLDVSTISRTVSDKFVDTPHGVIPLRFFFSSGMASDDGESQSRHAVKEQLKALIVAEDAKKPLSDDALMKMLNDSGVQIERRTVAKYREELGFPNSRQRKRHV